ncbi:type IV secretory system conjugative DNA transfer family protein [Mesorhizobium sp. WSM3224]|uniref:type IV secretory system conjugative DNA transfer family protein n=1 Tax=Mesorhizobium sp. WSM3224 TaxID=1040986 RepID=UPI00040D9DC4|nr:type IV secretory system conjugative DNA transfer family protein [Mesorhizobium sp. WSM3224]
MFGRLSYDLVKTLFKAAVAILPLVIWYPAWRYAHELWAELLIGWYLGGLSVSSIPYRFAYSAWPSIALIGPAATMSAALLLRRTGLALPLTAIAGVLGMAAATLLTAWPEATRLIALRPAYSWFTILNTADMSVLYATVVGFLAIMAGSRMLMGKSLRARDVKPVERASSDIFGHADWMAIAEGLNLFGGSAKSTANPLGGVVIGEAYRVDQDAPARRGQQFDPRDQKTWGKGGKSPLLTFDLSWGGTHGLVFAGSGAYKTVSVCVPTLLTWRGPIVTFDPSSELAPMLTSARTAMGRRAVSIDPMKGTGAFNALDWLAKGSPLIDGDIRSVVDWICGEKHTATRDAPHGASGKAFFEGRGKAIVEALLSDIVFDKNLPDDKRNLVTLAERLALPEKAMRAELQRIHEHSSSHRGKHLAGQLMGLVAETFSGVYGNMSEQTEWLTNPAYAKLVSGNSFRTRDFVSGKLDLFINIPMKVLESTPAVARVVVGSLLNAVYEADGTLPGGRVVFLLDEVARLGYMTSLARARDAGRKYGITLVMIYQSEGQLKEQWGDGGKSAWFESASWRSYAAIGSLEQARAVSEALGEHGVVLSSETKNRGKSARPLEIGTASTGASEQKSERGRRLATVSEILADARADEQFVFVQGRKPLRCGRAIYFRRPEMVAKVERNRFAPQAASS